MNTHLLSFDAGALAVLPESIWAWINVVASAIAFLSLLVCLMVSTRYSVAGLASMSIDHIMVLLARAGLGLIALNCFLDIIEIVKDFPHAVPREVIGNVGLALVFGRGAWLAKTRPPRSNSTPVDN